MCLHCRLNIAYCYGLQTWIFCRTPWTDTDQPFTIRTPLLTHSIRAWRRGCSAGHPRSYPPTAAIVVGLNREDVEWAKYRSNNVGLWHGAEAAVL